MTKDEKAILIALSLGDGYISKDNQLHITHSLAQEEYVHWKIDFLNRVCKGKRKSNISYKTRFDTRTNKTYKSCVATKKHKYFRIIRNWIYKPTKTYSRFILNKLTPAALAIWFMDDGNYKKNFSKKTGKLSHVQVSLYTHCAYDQAEIVRDYFLETYDIEFKIYVHKLKTSTSYYLCANTKNGRKFIDLIEPFVNIPCMRYKVDSNPTSARPLNTEGEDIV